MSPQLHDLFHLGELDDEISRGYVTVRRHLEKPLSIYNYTARAQFERRWNHITRTCRGLIVDDDGYIRARPWAKFFNHGEFGHEVLSGYGPIQVLDKLDGSLGILYPDGDDYSVATRGSFHSEQARHATDLWRARYAKTMKLDPEVTYLVEILYPENRIVVNYGNTDDLVLLGGVHTPTGRSIDVHDLSEWTGPRVDTFDYHDIIDVLHAPPRANAEGFVVWFRDTDERVKIKQEDYLRLHKLVTGVSERRIWEMLSSGEDPAAWLEGVPDEFSTFVLTTTRDIQHRYDTLREELEEHYRALIHRLPEGFSRAQLAHEVMAMTSYPLRQALFARHDGKDVSKALWQHVRPERHEPVFAGAGES